eukprot:Sspe_Gene.31171::Locus_15381_Transcript_1_1_Confidence_1.000_Length_1786::g.31171::m.31171
MTEPCDEDGPLTAHDPNRPITPDEVSFPIPENYPPVPAPPSGDGGADGPLLKAESAAQVKKPGSRRSMYSPGPDGAGRLSLTPEGLMKTSSIRSERSERSDRSGPPRRHSRNMSLAPSHRSSFAPSHGESRASRKSEVGARVMTKPITSAVNAQALADDLPSSIAPYAWVHVKLVNTFLNLNLAKQARKVPSPKHLQLCFRITFAILLLAGAGMLAGTIAYSDDSGEACCTDAGLPELTRTYEKIDNRTQSCAPPVPKPPCRNSTSNEAVAYENFCGEDVLLKIFDHYRAPRLPVSLIVHISGYGADRLVSLWDIFGRETWVRVPWMLALLIKASSIVALGFVVVEKEPHVIGSCGYWKEMGISSNLTAYADEYQWCLRYADNSCDNRLMWIYDYDNAERFQQFAIAAIITCGIDFFLFIPIWFGRIIHGRKFRGL